MLISQTNLDYAYLYAQIWLSSKTGLKSLSKVSFFSTWLRHLGWFCLGCFGFVLPSVAKWLSATAQQICHSVTALNLDSGWAQPVPVEPAQPVPLM